MILDLTLILLFKKEFGFPFFLIFHHILIIFTYSFGLLSYPAYGAYFMCGFQAQELTSPFLANRWFLLECDMKDSDLYWWNGLFLLISYSIVRIGYGNYIVYQMVAYKPEDLFRNPTATSLLIAGVSFQLLQYYFYYKIMEVAVKHAKSLEKKKEKSS